LAIALIGRCYAGLDAAGLRKEVLRRLRRMLAVDAAFFATVDPMTFSEGNAKRAMILRGSTSQFRGHPRTLAQPQLLHLPPARLGCRAFGC
jgi:hypothetical protein